MQEEFDLETILSVIARYNITHDYNNILKLYSFMFENPDLSINEFLKKYEIGRKHILSLYPELNDIDFDYHYLDSYVKKQRQKFGDKLLITTIKGKEFILKK